MWLPGLRWLRLAEMVRRAGPICNTLPIGNSRQLHRMALALPLAAHQVNEQLSPQLEERMMLCPLEHASDVSRRERDA
jgi:hypothetical protein